MKLITGKRSVKLIAAFLLNLMVWDVVFPTVAYGLTGGPSQPEVQSFEPVGTTEMVDLFSGDFTYNIPLLDVEGFPINISYHSGVGMDDEASWVGLGWNINPGVVNRNMRGIPDDFKGNPITSTTNIKENKTWGLNLQAKDFEIFGKQVDGKEKDETGKPKKEQADTSLLEGTSLTLSFGITYNNYRGLGYEFSINPTLKAFDRDKNAQFPYTLGLKASASSFDGADIGVTPPDFTVKFKKSAERGLSFATDFNVNSRDGMQDISFRYNYGKKKAKNTRRYSGVQVNPLSYTPALQNEFRSVSANLGVVFGAEFLGVHFKAGISGSYHSQFLRSQNRTNYGYGYMYSHEAKNFQNDGVWQKDVMYDLNRENDGPFSKEKPLLPMPVFTYDMFSVAGEGTGGMVRPFRSDVGVMHDEELTNTTIGLGLSVETGLGNTAKVGLDLSGNYGYTVSGPWQGNNGDFDIIRHLEFKPQKSESYFEPFYFRSTGEKTVANNDFWNTMGADEPVSIEIGNQGRLNSKLKGVSGRVDEVKGGIQYFSRQARNMAVSLLNNKEASVVGLDRRVRVYPQNSFSLTNRTMDYNAEEDRETSKEFKHLMSEMTVTNPDGRRYVYGIPAYNKIQRDVAFRVVNVENPNSLEKDRSTGLVKFNSGDNSTGNGRGEDNFYNKTEIPAYAHSFLLSAVLSSDYVDITGNGVSDDDIGTAVKFNYTRPYSDYKWRTPYGNETHQGNYDEGLKSDIYDDKANYVYGEKEIWYVHSIESKNYVACFYTSMRHDGCQVADEDGARDGDNAFYRLDSIKLFTKEELVVNTTNAVPLKTVHFEYDYSLCPNTKNNKNYTAGDTTIQANSGKLTLKKIYFTYGKSKKGRTNSYQFTYSDNNPRYNFRGYDRWGNFKPNATKDECDDITNPNSRLSNVDDPYVLQNKDSADKYSSAWSLSQIKLPSGGVIKVNYESDDYAYIQDRQAGQMFKITGINTSTTFKNDAANLYIGESNHMYIFFDLVEPFSKTLPSNEFNKKVNDYYAGIDKMYFKFLVDLTGKNDYEYVSGYVDKHETGFSSKNPSSPNYDVGYIKLKEAPLKDRKGQINPISKASWNFMRLYAPKKLGKVFSDYEMAPGATAGAFKSLLGSMEEMLLMVNGFGKNMRIKGAGQTFVFNKSFIRLNNPTKMKYGGGVRVKQLTLSDSWDEMVSGQVKSSYGQKYLYTKEEKQPDGTFRTISSGVAVWEPGIGGDENSHKQPVNYSQSNALAPNARYMVEKPIGESVFPGPGVGYSQVTTINLKPTENIKRTGTGKVVNEFYTAYDFPIILRNTVIDKKPKSPGLENFLFRLLKVYVKDRMFVSQGYSIELNDMHGKPKAQWVYEEGNEQPISGVKYEYQYKRNQWGQNQLTSQVDLVKPDGAISSGEIGREVDYMFDTRNYSSYHVGGTGQGNMDAGIAGILPMITFSLFGNLTRQDLEFGSAVNTKVIMRYGILKATEVYENGSTVKSENVLYDAQTGDVLLTKTTNEFNDTIYTFNYPAHFAYVGMEQAYKNLGLYFTDINITNGNLSNINNYTNYFTPGDELYVEYEKYNTGAVGSLPLEKGIIPTRIWAVESPFYSDSLIFMTRTGQPFSTNLSETGKSFKYNLKIIRSGRRNMPSASIGTVVSLNNPVRSGTLSFDSVINAGVVEFADYWPVEHKNVFEAVESVTEIYTGAGPAPESSPVSGGGCNDECYNQVMDILLSYPTTMVSYKTLLTATVGDTINLMKPPYRDAFLCALDQTRHCPQFELFKELRDSIIIYTSQSLITASIYDKNSDAHYAVNYELGRKNNLSALEMYSQRGPSNPENEPFGLPLPEHINSTDNVASQNGNPCGACDLIRTRPAYTKRAFRLKNDCIMNVIVQCVYGSTCNFTKATPLNCNIFSSLLTFQTTIKTIPYSPGFQSLYGCNEDALVYTEFSCPYKYGKGPYKKPNTSGSGGSGGDPSGGGDGSGFNTCNDSICDDSTLLYPVNPYVYGIKGNWRPKRNWLFYNKRNQAATTNIRKDGTYNSYVDFWKKPMNPEDKWDTGSVINNKWTWNILVTKFNRTGNEVENMDALNIYSSALFGYGNSIVKAVANNARLRQIAFDGMEDYGYPTSSNETHFSFNKHSSIKVDTVSHSGKYSLTLDSNKTASVLNCVIYAETENPRPITDTASNLVMLKPTEILDKFSPDSGKYIISAWVKEQVNTPQVASYTDTVEVKIYNNNCTNTYKFTPSGPIIEGWQRVEGKFVVPDSATCIEVTLKSNSSRRAYFDDIRIHPWQANIKSFVYHPQTLRLIAELDENNYATFYEYDQEGRLVRIKRETERGIVTLQESRTGLKINND